MNTSLFILLCLVIIYIVRIVYSSLAYNDVSIKYLLVSFFIVSNILNYGYPLMELNYNGLPGVLGTKIRIEGYFFIIAILIFISDKQTYSTLKDANYYITIFIGLFAVSLLNPNNIAKDATLVSLFNISTFIFFVFIIIKTVPHSLILKGLWDGFTLSTIIQFLIIILYPILNVIEVTNWFMGENIDIRLERPGGIGTFHHPNALAAYMTFTVVFYYSAFLYRYKRNITLALLVISEIVIIFTYSRTGIATSLLLILMIYKKYYYPRKPLINLSNVPQVLFAILFGIVIVVATPILDIITNSNLQEMIFARWYHWLYGFVLVNISPLIGVGLNSHLEYLRCNVTPIFADYLSTEFAFSNSIHNIYIIILSETGIIGIIVFLASVITEWKKAKKKLIESINRNIRLMQLVKIGFILSILLNGITDKAIFTANIMQLWLFVLMYSISKPRISKVATVIYE